MVGKGLLLRVHTCPACGRVAGWYIAGMGHNPHDADRWGWCGKCYENQKGRQNWSGHMGYRVPRRKEEECMPLKKPVVNSSAGGGMPPASWLGSSLAGWPSLMEFLSSTSGEGGSRRRTGTLLISTGQGIWTGKLKDFDLDVYAFVTSETLTGLFDSLEKVCCTGEADWRKEQKDWPGKSGRK